MFGTLKKKVLVATAGLIVFAIAGTGVALALDAPLADPPPEQSNPHQLVIERAAEILEIAPESLGSTLQQAQQEVGQERLDERIAEVLARAVENEVLTQDEADEILSWWVARSDKVSPELLQLLARNSDDIDAVYARLVESGRLTEDKAAAIAEWYAGKPDSLENVARLLFGGQDRPKPQVRPNPRDERPNFGEGQGQARPRGNQAQGRVRPGQGRGPVPVLPNHGRGRIDIRYNIGPTGGRPNAGQQGPGSQPSLEINGSEIIG
jgi:hypothetical protein